MRSQDPEAINPRPNPRTVHIASYLHYDLGVGLHGLGPKKKKKKQRKAPAASRSGFLCGHVREPSVKALQQLRDSVGSGLGAVNKQLACQLPSSRDLSQE